MEPMGNVDPAALSAGEEEKKQKKKTEGALSETRVTEGSSLTFCLSFSSFPTWFILRVYLWKTAEGFIYKNNYLLFSRNLFFPFFKLCAAGTINQTGILINWFTFSYFSLIVFSIQSAVRGTSIQLRIALI